MQDSESSEVSFDSIIPEVPGPEEEGRPTFMRSEYVLSQMDQQLPIDRSISFVKLDNEEQEEEDQDE